MGGYSDLKGTAPISSPSGGVWRIQKKRRTDDRQRRKEKERERSKEEKDIRDSVILQEQEKDIDTDVLDTDKQVEYGSSKVKKQARRKIDLTI